MTMFRLLCSDSAEVARQHALNIQVVNTPGPANCATDCTRFPPAFVGAAVAAADRLSRRCGLPETARFDARALPQT
jgi:hypothetical protein